MKINPRHTEAFFKLLAHREKIRARRRPRAEPLCRHFLAQVALPGKRSAGFSLVS
jgi:hypothetical protein